MKKLVVPLAIAVVLLAGGVAYLAFFKKTTPEPKKVTYFTYALSDTFITNVKNSQSLFKTSITFEVEEDNQEKQKAFLDEHSSVIRDSILFLLREKTYDELRASDIHDKLSKEIVDLLSEKLNVTYIKSVYFNEYVIQ